MRLIDIEALKGCAIIRPHGKAEIALTQKFSERLNHFEIPTIEAEPVRHGRWETQELAPEKWKFCSLCGYANKRGQQWNCCPCCGAKMDLRTPTQIQLDEADDVLMGGTEK